MRAFNTMRCDAGESGAHVAPQDSGTSHLRTTQSPGSTTLSVDKEAGTSTDRNRVQKNNRNVQHDLQAK